VNTDDRHRIDPVDVPDDGRAQSVIAPAQGPN
jgi:hypothetical protein